ncbi:50S ribosomal protein L11 methyltransferase [Altererythrobacter lutimaris]|uniref:50S ribosomal protein L11 methyltransferase n=1 Tax=Altererythrobacter lutimaris TaxID=2743979 RepID=A0A850H707_9SPHN|nr:50S ribosomal protein L11 methyltransferase [Altererythrobacter lutimaris]NVE95044.1 50S ribosomal protein L11 methyltransferase [Altererythrobacter lutimaris]
MAEAASNDPLGNPAAFLLMVRGLSEAGRTGMVSSLIDKANALYAGDPFWEAAIRQSVVHLIPGFHDSMLRDTARNRVYREALEGHAAGRRVLDIGTGSGLLSMMAARAGATHVYACEANALLARAANKVIEANGLADRITVLTKPSIELDPEADLGSRVDLIVSEIISDDMYGEALLPSLNDASRRLIKDDGIFLPSMTSVQVALVDFGGMPEFTSDVEGFDLSASTQLLSRNIAVRASRADLELQSSSASLFMFHHAPGLTQSVVDSEIANVTTRKGRANAIAQWIKFECGEGHQYANAPGGPANLHWRIQLTPIEPLELSEGEVAAIEAHRDQLGMVLHARAA